MTTLMGNALLRRVEGKPPTLFPRQSASANSTATPNTDDIASCTSTCMIDAFSVVPECNYDMPCMCAKDDFRTSVAACMKKTCNFGGPGYDEILQNVLDQCVNCAYGGLSCTNTTVTGSGDDSLGITIPSTRASASTSKESNVTTGKDDNEKSSSTPVAAIAGGVVGGLVVIALVGVLIWWMARKNKRSNATVALPATPTGEVKFNQPPSQPQVQPHLAYNQPQHQPQQHPVPTPYGTDFAPATMYQQQTYAPQQPNADLGYVPPSQFMQYAPPPGAYPTSPSSGVSASNVSTGSSAPILGTGSYRPPSSDASSSSGAPPFNPYAQLQQQQQQQQQPRPLTLHTDNSAPSAWPRDEKRPLNVMSADTSEPRPMSPGDGLPAYRR